MGDCSYPGANALTLEAFQELRPDFLAGTIATTAMQTELSLSLAEHATAAASAAALPPAAAAAASSPPAPALALAPAASTTTSITATTADGGQEEAQTAADDDEAPWFNIVVLDGTWG